MEEAAAKAAEEAAAKAAEAVAAKAAEEAAAKAAEAAAAAKAAAEEEAAAAKTAEENAAAKTTEAAASPMVEEAVAAQPVVDTALLDECLPVPLAADAATAMVDVHESQDAVATAVADGAGLANAVQSVDGPSAISAAEHAGAIAHGLRAADPAEFKRSLSSLGETLARAPKDTCEQMYQQLRTDGSLDQLLDCVGHQDPFINRKALLVLGNACNEFIVGIEASQHTKALLRRGNRFERLLRCLYSEDEITAVYAVGACQNTCTTYEGACAVRDGGVMERLEHLELSAKDPQLRGFAGDCLYNMKLALAEGEKAAAIAELLQSSAASTMQNAVRRWIARRRKAKLTEAARRAATGEGEVLHS